VTETTASEVARAIKLDGFSPKIRAGGIDFHGRIKVRDFEFAVRLEYESLEFDRPPWVFLENAEILDGRVLPHVDASGQICAVDRRRYVADRYLAPQQARGIIKRVADLLNEGLTAYAEAEIIEEFTRYWGGPEVHVNFGPFDGFAEPEETDKAGWFFKKARGPSWAKADSAVVLACEKPLSFRENDRRPDTLEMALHWLDCQEPRLSTKALDGLAALGPADPRVILHAPNGVVSFKLLVSRRGAAQVRAIRTLGAWSRLLRGPFGRELRIVRERGVRIDMDYVLGSNGEQGTAALSGKHVVLVGCGAIGGYLSLVLAQLGAGLGGGSLALVDGDHLNHRNIARHRCGLDKVGLRKATACKREIEQSFPDLSVTALDRDVSSLKNRVMRAELAIDATGEQGVGEMLNAWRLERQLASEVAPDMLHVWVEGNGAAVQTYFSSDPAFGCYHCLQPDHNAPSRFPIMRSDAAQPMTTGCGELAFNPYGPSAPMAAASLAAQHAADWARGAPRELLRSIRLNYKDTQERKPTNPTKSPACPACAGHA